MKRLERVIALLIIETVIVSVFDCKITNEEESSYDIFETNESFYRFKRSGVESQDCEHEIKISGLTLINLGINTLAPTIIIQNRFYYAVKELYNKLLKNEKTLKEKVEYYLESEFPNLTLKLRSESNFQKSFIFAYTTDYGFKELNKALRDHNCATKILTNKEKSLAPYAAALMAILMHWDGLESTTNITYRGSIITNADLNTYRNSKSRSIVWLNFASSSTDFKGAFDGNVTFNINNKNSGFSRWRPKRICKCSNYPDECEALYPPGSAFDVDAVTWNGNNYEIDLTLRHNFLIGRKRRSVSTDPASKRGFCYINSALSCQINMWNVLVLGILGKCVSNVFL